MVTGAAGFLGSHLVRGLHERGDVVRAFAHAPPPPGLLPDGVEVETGDVRDVEAVARATRGSDVVIHTASNFRHAASDGRAAHSINVTGSLNVARAALEAGVRHYLHCSTIGVHGSVREIPADEETPYNPGDIYQETKLEAELAIRDFAEREGLVTTVIRPISMFGPGDRRMLKLFRMIAKRRFFFVGSGETLFQPAYVDDVVAGFLLCMDDDRAKGDVFIVGSGEYLSLRDLTRIIAAELGVPPPTLRLPMGPMLLAARVCEAVCVPLGLEPPLHRRRLSFYRNDRAFKIDKARRILGYEPRHDLREGIRKTIRAYREAGWLDS